MATMSSGGRPAGPGLVTRRAFVATVVLGFVGIFGSIPFALSNHDTTAIVLTVALPLAAMALYLMVTYALDRSAYATSQFPDSVYYQGFLFTLASLTAALISYTSKVDATAVDDTNMFAHMAAKFGVALSTTLVGLAFRIYMVHFRETQEESMARSEQSLAQAAQDLQLRLNSMSVDIEAQRKALHQQMTEALELSMVSLNGTIEGASCALKEAIETSSGALDAAVEKANESLVRLTGSAESELATAAKALSEVIREQTTLARKLVKKQEKFADSAEQLGAALAPLASDASSLSRDLKMAVESVNSLGNLGSLGVAAGELSHATASSAKALAEHNVAIGQVHVQLQALLDQMPNTLDGLEAQRRELLKQVDDGHQALGLMATHLVDAAGFVRDELAGDGQSAENGGG